MTETEIMQIQIMNRFWDRLSTLSDSELMTRKHAEMEMQIDLKRVNKEITRRNFEI